MGSRRAFTQLTHPSPWRTPFHAKLHGTATVGEVEVEVEQWISQLGGLEGANNQSSVATCGMDGNQGGRCGSVVSEDCAEMGKHLGLQQNKRHHSDPAKRMNAGPRQDTASVLSRKRVLWGNVFGKCG